MPSILSSFSSVQEELEYYKNHSSELELDLAETRYALEEFQLSSKELEEELEKEIDSTERRYNEIKIRNESMRQEVEDWKVCCKNNRPSALQTAYKQQTSRPASSALSVIRTGHCHEEDDDIMFMWDAASKHYLRTP